jgi:hypothetical protein
MRHTNAGGMRLALERLKWALKYPKRRTEDEWQGRLCRAVAFLQTAWDDHTSTSDFELAHLCDLSLLPFTALSQRLLDLRRDHTTLTEQLAALKKETEAGSRPDLLCRRTRKLLLLVENHLAAEQALVLDESADPSLR